MLVGRSTAPDDYGGAPDEKISGHLPLVVAILPPRPWAERLLAGAVDGRCRLLRASTVEEASRLLEGDPDVVVWHCPVDGRVPSPVDALQHIRSRSPSAEIIAVVEGEKRVPLALYCELVLAGVRALVEAGRGSADKALMARLEECFALRREECLARERLQECSLLEEIDLVGDALVETGILSLVQRAALLSDVPVLITGETGTGKRLLAEAIHRLDRKRRDGPLVVVNCAAIAEGLAESALFGHVRGAFTGAESPRQGYFRAADGGTLFLDEISEMPLALQAKLLRVLEVGRVMPVGEDRECPVDVRVIAATNQDLSRMVREGTFRADLYHRLAIIRIHVPPLRERPSDIPALVRHFLSKYAHYYAGRIEEVEPAVLELLARLPNPGNVRELENIIRYSLLTKRVGKVLQLSDLPPGLIRAGANVSADSTHLDLLEHFSRLIRRGMGLSELIEHCERLILSAALELTGQNRTRAAQLLRTTRRTIQNKLLKHRLAQD